MGWLGGVWGRATEGRGGGTPPPPSPHLEQHHFWLQAVPGCSYRGPLCVLLACATYAVRLQLDGLTAARRGRMRGGAQRGE